jgi:peptidylprolyl isomerase
MRTKKGDKVIVEYEGRLDSGEVFDSSETNGHGPISFTIGKGDVISGFDSAVVGMKEGEEKEITIKPKEAYGNYNPELTRELDRKKLPMNEEPKEGMVVIMKSPEGLQVPAHITKVAKDKITIDVNHPMAGKTLFFRVKLLKIE